MLSRLLRTLLISSLLLLIAATAQASTAVGTLISNTATASYIDTATGLTVYLNSNTVTTSVAAAEALTLVAGQNVLTPVGSTFAISHTLTNTGNIATTYGVSVSLASGAGFSPLNLHVVHDINSNGVVDPGEPTVSNSSTLTLPPDASANLLLVGQVPAGAGAGQAAPLVLSVISQLQGVSVSNTDTLNVTYGAAVQVTLATASSSASAGAILIFNATAVNQGSLAANPTTVSVDGVSSELFVLRVPIPVNTTFVGASAANPSTQLLYHVLGTPSQNYVTTVPSANTVDAIAWGISALAPNNYLSGQFSVQVNGNATGAISALAYANWRQQSADLTSMSNSVVLALPTRPVSIAFYNSSSYTTAAIQNTAGNPLFVQVDAAACNVDPLQIGTIVVTLTSQLTGDVETFTALETGPNTGIFRIPTNVPTAHANTHIVAAGNGVLEVLRNDVVTATTTACGSISASATTTLLIDPSGTVYNSNTNQPVAGATVQLIDVTGAGNGGNPGGAAIVFQADGVTAAPSVVVTGTDGNYAFPLVLPSTYVLQVTPPTGYTFPSVLPATSQPAGRLIDSPGSYGGRFVVASRPVRFDLPLDTGGTGGLFVQKVANKATAEVGDFVDYSVRLNNVAAVTLANTVVRDTLPLGFAYLRGTARLNGAPIADPTGGAGPRLQFALGNIASGGQPTLTYRVRVGAGSQSGSGINTAQAFSGALQSNRSSVRVRVVGGVFSNKAYLIGKVFASCSGAEVQSLGDRGVPGVRIYLEDGTYAVTDEEGKYSLYGLDPHTHVAKVDSTTLPLGATLKVLNNRNAFDAASQFVDLANGELHKADFAIDQCTPNILAQIKARQQALGNPSEISQAATGLLSSLLTATTDSRSLPASGSIGLPGVGSVAPVPNGSAKVGAPGTGLSATPAVQLQNGRLPLGAVGDLGGAYAPEAQGIPRPLFAPAESLLPPVTAPSRAAIEPMLSAKDNTVSAAALEQLLPTLNGTVDFVGLHNLQVLSSAQTRVRVKGPFGAVFELFVNEQPIPRSQVGKKSSLEKNAVVAWEYIGVDLKPGLNTLSVRAIDSFGNLRGSAQIRVLAPGPLAKIELQFSPQAVADGVTAVPVTLALRDANGLSVAARTQVSLQSSLGQWQTPDLDAYQNGTQVFIEGGEGQFLLLPPAQPGKGELTVSSGSVKAKGSLEFSPNLRPLIAVGIVSGVINLRKLNQSALQSTQSGDVFERQIQTTSRSFNDGQSNAAARTTLFLKGKVLGSSLLTLAYDSDKPADTALFRDIQPNQFYPVYGDSSVRGFDAQSTGKLYVMLQNGTRYVLWGDYSTQSDNPARQLTQYSRALNGAKARWQEGAFTLEGFASRTSTTQVVQEFRANGTSGPFRLNINGVVNSQQVHIITRNRNQNSVIVNETALGPFSDYEIEPYTGLLLLKTAVPSVDADLNPIFIRVSYAVDEGGPQHTVAGMDARVQVTPELTVGASVLRDSDPANQQNLTGLNVTAKLAEKTLLTAEIAQSSTDLQGTGTAQRLEIRHEGVDLQGRLWGVRTSNGFYNPNSLQSAGQSEYGAKMAYTLNDKTRLVGEALKTDNSLTGAEQSGAEIKIERSLPANAKLEAGLRYSSANNYSLLSAVPPPGSAVPIVPSPTALASATSNPSGYTTARFKLSAPVPTMPQADVYGLVDYAIDGSGGREVGVGGNYALSPSSRLYVRHDFINSLGNANTLNPSVSRYTTVGGINSDLSDSTQLFNEYRLGDSLDGRTSEAALGLRKLWRLSNGIGLTGSVQRIKSFSGSGKDDSNAFSLGVDYTASERWKASGQLQWQNSQTSRSWLLSAALAHKLNERWTLLQRALYSHQINQAPNVGERKLVTAQSGLAYRPVDSNVWNALGRVEYKHDFDSTLGPGLNRDESSVTASTHLNVQPSRSWVMSGRYAAKWGKDRSSDINSRSFTQLMGGRSTWDLNDRWDVGVQAWRLWGNGAAESAVGAEVGYLVVKNTWASLGYNRKGFSGARADLAGDAHTQRGVYLRLNFKFDENLFKGRAAAGGSRGEQP